MFGICGCGGVCVGVCVGCGVGVWVWECGCGCGCVWGVCVEVGWGVYGVWVCLGNI